MRLGSTVRNSCYNVLLTKLLKSEIEECNYNVVKIVWRLYILTFVTDKNCHQITRKQDLYTELAEIGNWEALCTHLEVPEATLDGLVHAHLENTAKKQRCLAAYFDQGNACWDKVVEVVAGYPFFKKKLAKQIADKYGVTWQG